MEVKFLALIKSVNSKSLVSLEKETRLLLEFKSDNDILNKINRLHKPDELVEVTIRESKK